MILCFSALVAIVSVAAAAAAPGAAPQRSGTLGPESGETLRSWTDRWLEGPAQLIATDDEKSLYAELGTVSERLQFIRLFWERRDPTLRGPDNEFRDEFQRRLDYANEQFGNGEPGWKTAFGQVALVVGIPDRAISTSQGMAGLSERPLAVWSYDRRIPEWPAMENFIFAYRTRKWRLLPHSEDILRGSARQAQTAWDMTTSLEVVPDDFLRVQRAMIAATTLQPDNYGFIDRVSAAVAFPESDIPFAWQARFAATDTAGVSDVEVEITLRLDALFYHTADDLYRSRMLITATLWNDTGDPLAAASEPFVVEIPLADLADRADETISRSVHLEAPAGTYVLELVLEEPALGYRTVYRDDLEIPLR